ncbi:MAG: DUF2199 domain-containing protein [Pseudoruegeria sp.]
MIGRLFGKSEFRYRCRECGRFHSGSPSFSVRYPCYFFDVPEEDRDERIRITDDICLIEPSSDDVDGSMIYCIRVNLVIPIKGSNDPFLWGIWVTQSKESFEEYIATFGEDQSAMGSFGWLPVDLPFYNVSDAGAPLDHLECDVQWGGCGMRPKIALWDNAHQLAIDQRDGINWRKAVKIASVCNTGC